MNLLARTARDLRRLIRADAGFSFGVVLVAVALEVIGRQTAHGGFDFQDLGALLTLLVAGGFVVARHRRSPLGWVAGIISAGRRLGAWLRRGTFEIGLDLRGNPPVRRGSPPAVRWLATALAVWVVLAAWLAPDCPHRL